MLVNLCSPILVQAKTKVGLNLKNYSGYKGESVDLVLYRKTNDVNWSSKDKSIATVYQNKKVILSVLGEKEEIVWSSTNEKIATVSKSGVVLGKEVGKCYIKATADDHSYKCSVTVKAPQIDKSSSMSVLTVSHKGIVAGHNIGNARVVAVMNGKQYVCNVTLTPTPTPTLTPTPSPEPLFYGYRDGFNQRKRVRRCFLSNAGFNEGMRVEMKTHVS